MSLRRHNIAQSCLWQNIVYYTHAFDEAQCVSKMSSMRHRMPEGFQIAFMSSMITWRFVSEPSLIRCIGYMCTSVNYFTTASRIRKFWQNERIICLLPSSLGALGWEQRRIVLYNSISERECPPDKILGPCACLLAGGCGAWRPLAGRHRHHRRQLGGVHF